MPRMVLLLSLLVVLVRCPVLPLPSVAPAGGRFGWPVALARVVRRFDPPPQPWLAGHRGVDLAAAPVGGGPGRRRRDGRLRRA